jgi:tetratricopeptide (TPR) repeat protein
MLGSVLELQGDGPAALERFRETVAADPTCSAGHAGIARLCEKAGRTDEAIDALERWAAAAQGAGDASGCGARLLHAAELDIARERFDAAEAHLRRALDATSENPRAWVLLAEILSDCDRIDEILRLAPEALAQEWASIAADAVARLSLLHARALEQRNDPATACSAYADAVRNDPRCAEAALAHARLLRARGDWTEAADALQTFCDEHPEPDHRDLAEAHYKLARLLSGPLEDIGGAIRCFERALEIAPDHPKAREPLASLLAVMPERRDEAIVHHAALLEAEPTRSASLRSLYEIAAGRDLDDLSRFGLAVLRAIGTASPNERLEAPDFLPRAIVATPALEDPIGEIARRVVQHASETLDELLGSSPEQSALTPEHFPARMRAAEREVAAAGLDRFSDEELGDLVCELAAFSLGDDAERPGSEKHLDSRLVESLDRALGRWTRRKIRRSLEETSLDQLQAIDFGAWRLAVRGLAAAVAVDAGQGDLRTALVALCREGEETPHATETEDWTTRIQGEPVANELLRRIAASWCRELAQS